MQNTITVHLLILLILLSQSKIVDSTYKLVIIKVHRAAVVF